MTDTTTKNINDQLSLFEVKAKDAEIVKENKEMILRKMKKLINKKLLDGTTIDDYMGTGVGFEGGFGWVKQYFQKDEEHLEIKNFKAIKSIIILLREEVKFWKEIEMLMELNLENVIKIEKIFFQNEKGFNYVHIVMPWLDHTVISWMLGKEQQQDDMTEDLPSNIRSFEEVRSMLLSILEGINAIHFKRIIHLDIKFDNILVREVQQEKDEEGHETKPKYAAVIADLGIGKNLSKLTSTAWGTPGYKPPEVSEFSKKKASPETENDDSIEKSDFFTPKADIYSFGVMLYKIFIHETEGIDKTKINKQKIKERISKIFQKDKDNISETIIDDIEDILLICLENEISKRPHAANLFFDHPFFNSSISKCPKEHLRIQKNPSNSIGFEENQSPVPTAQGDTQFDEEFLKGLSHLEGKTKDLKKAKEIFENLSTSDKKRAAAAKFVVGWMLNEGFGGKCDQRNGQKMMKIYTGEAKQYFESFLLAEKDNLGFFSFFISVGARHRENALQNLDPNFADEDLHLYKSTNKSNSFAYASLGKKMSDTGFEKDKLQGFKLCTLSADHGNCSGEYHLAWMYENGIGTEKDYAMAAKFYQLSVDQGYCCAQHDLALLYQKGSVVEMNKAKAAELFKLAADQGYASAQFYFARCCRDGNGIEKNLKMARDYYEKSAEQGLDSARKELIRCI